TRSTRDWSSDVCSSDLLHACEIKTVIERAEAMRAVGPGLVGVGMTRAAIVVHRQDAQRDEAPFAAARERRAEVALALFGRAALRMGIHRVDETERGRQRGDARE